MANVLIIDDNEMFCEMLSQMVTDQGHLVSSVPTLREGLETATSGKYEVIFLDVQLPDGNGLEILPKIREIPDSPEVIIITGVGDQDGAELAMKNGAWDYVEKQSAIKQMMLPLVRAVKYQEEKKGRRLSQEAQQSKPGKIIGFTGAKGGVGTSTVALNIAAVLAGQNRQVIAAELKSGQGAFSLMLNQKPESNLKDLLEIEPGCLTPADLSRFLHKSSPGLRLLFGPQKAADFTEIDPLRAAALIQMLAGLADYVILDLPAYPSGAFGSVIRLCNYVVMVSEREQISVRAGKTLLELFKSWGLGDANIGAVITNRIVLPISMKLETIKTHLNCDILGVVPYSLEACSMSQISGQPIALFQPNNIAAVALIALARALTLAPGCWTSEPDDGKLLAKNL
jgi:MinD-like ATPase involved in chromosome partitioning or flagellar assembly/ActR/RegA family two-component response regulator